MPIKSNQIKQELIMRTLLQFQKATVLLTLMFLAFAASAAPSGPVIGKITLVLGTVVGVDQDGDTFEVVRGGDLYAGYSLETQRRSLVRAELNDGTKLTLSQNSSATLDSFSFNETARTGGFNATVQRGGFKYASGELGKFFAGRQHSAISTPNGIIGVRGTVIEATIDPLTRRITLVVTEGNVSFITPAAPGAEPTSIEVGVDEDGNVLDIDGITASVGNEVPAALQQVINDLLEFVEQAESETGTTSEAAADGEEEANDEEETGDADEAGDEPQTVELTYDGESGEGDSEQSGGGGDLEIVDDGDGPVIKPVSPIGAASQN